MYKIFFHLTAAHTLHTVLAPSPNAPRGPNGIGTSARHRNPRSVQAQAVPRRRYSGYVASGMTTLASMLRVHTLDASAEAL